MIYSSIDRWIETYAYIEVYNLHHDESWVISNISEKCTKDLIFDAYKKRLRNDYWHGIGLTP